jgi:cytoskeletal protein RodZ
MKEQTMNETNGKRHLSSAEVIETFSSEEDRTFYDPANPALAAPRETGTRTRKTWKRKLVGWCFVLLLIVGGVFALYLLLRVNRVNVQVNANARRESLAARPQPSPTAENGLSAEAINIARQAIGNDTDAGGNPNPTPSPNASPTVSPSANANIERSLAFTDNSPAYPHANDAGSVNGNQADLSKAQTQQASSMENSAQVQTSHANPTQTLFVEDAPPKPSPATVANTVALNRADRKLTPNETVKMPPAVLPPFGTLLPVRTQGVIFSLRNNSYARLELSRDCQGDGWSLPKGTLLVGRVAGSEHDRAFVNAVGYIDPRTNRFVKMTGEVLGSDGGSGIPGSLVVVDRNRLRQTLSKVASSGLQVAGMMAGALTGRGTVVINGAGSRIVNPITDQAGRALSGTNDKRSFVKVAAGQSAYVMVADLPKELRAIDAPGEEDFARAANSLTERDVMELILFGTPEEVRAALPLMNAEQKKLVIKSIGTENQEP